MADILKQQAGKTLNDGFEFIRHGSLTLAMGQVPQKKGLDRLDRLRLAASKVVESMRARSLAQASICLDRAGAAEARAVAEGIFLSAYEFTKYKSEKKREARPEAVHLVAPAPTPDAWRAALREAEVVSRQANACRDLVNEPGSNLDPEAFAQEARRLAQAWGLGIRVRDEVQLQAEGFQGLWTVGKGSDRPPRMVTLEYPGQGGPRHLALVGKGITFDTGGISLKPGAGMWEMKSDMAGAATVLHALGAIAQLGLPLPVTAVLCLAENRPGNRSVLPGDIFTAKNGKTVMIDNTDAEGRLVLSDGLAEAGAKGATHIIDLATLTGAVVRALGPAVAGLFSNDAAFAASIRKAGEAVGEKLCELPLEREYREYLDDPAADMKNVGKAEGGAITAALFLEEFVPPGAIWSHWDIAGTAFTPSTWKYFKPGATGWGLKTLVETAKALAAG